MIQLKRNGRAWRRWKLICGLCVAAAQMAIWTSVAPADSPADQPPISYSDAAVDDPVARLQSRIDRGNVTITFEKDHGYLKSVLAALDVPVSSQGLVFSKTSFQRDRIAPATPRAIYFSDDVYVGWVQGGDVVELSAVDSQKGAIFYTLPQEHAERPRFRRQTHECLQCHDSSLSQGVAGHFVRSVFPDPRGQPILSAGTAVTGHDSPLRERWGGWYVTGHSGEQLHRGNLIVRDRAFAARPDQIDLTAGTNRLDLAGLCDTAPYLAPHSDLVALMVLEHQTQMHNLLTRANWQTRQALRDEASMNSALGRPVDQRLDSTTSRIRSAGEPLVRGLLFADEAPLHGPVSGTSQFAQEFAARGTRDSQGRSLRDFDLSRRMFRYPLSYLIYSEAFHRQPEPLKEYVYRRIWQVLQGEDTSGRFAHLSETDRQSILAILRETLLEMPDYWK